MRIRTTLRVASVNYLNSAPYRILRELPWIQFNECSPAECARRLHEGECDLALLPVAEGILSGEYTFLDYGIVARGEVESVLVLSELPWKEVTHVVLDTSSRTSVILLRTLVKLGALELNPDVTFSRVPPGSIAESISGKTAGLVIGDLAMSVRKRFPHVIDLAGAWLERTGKPFVFAAWALRQGRLTNLQRSTLAGAFERSLANLEPSLLKWAAEFDMTVEDVRRYLSSIIHFRIDGDALAGLREFHRDASSLGFLPAGELRIEPALEPHPRYNGGPKAPHSHAVIGFSRRSWSSILQDRLAGKRLSIQDTILLADEAPSPDLMLSAFAANESADTKEHSPAEVLLTNMCALRFPVSSLFRAPGQQGGFVLSPQEIAHRCAASAGEIWLRGGITPECNLPYYESILSLLRKTTESRLCALSPQEIRWLSGETGASDADILARLKEAGLSVLGDGAFAPLLDKFTAKLPGLLPPREWFAMRIAAHDLGIRSRCVHALGHAESQRDRIIHLSKIRRLQDESSSVESVWCLRFPAREKENSKSMTAFLREVALARLFLDNVPRLETTDLRGHTPFSELGEVIGA